MRALFKLYWIPFVNFSRYTWAPFGILWEALETRCHLLGPYKKPQGAFRESTETNETSRILTEAFFETPMLFRLNI